PGAAGAPGAVPLLTLAGEIVAVDVGGIAGSDFGNISFVVHELAGSVAGYLKLLRDTQTQHAVFSVGKGHSSVRLRCEGGDAVDDPFVSGGAEEKVCRLVEQDMPLLIGPAGFIAKVISPEHHIVARWKTGGGMPINAVGVYPPVLGFFCGRDSIGVVPEIQTVHLFIIEPKTKMMGMVDGFARARADGKAACDQLAVGSIYGVQHGLLQAVGIYKGGEGLTACGDDHTRVGRIDANTDRQLLRGKRTRHQRKAG